MRALVLAQIPYPNVAPAVATDELSLVGMDDNIIDRHTMAVISLNGPASGIPNLHSAIFGARDHPFAFAVKGNSGNISGVAFKSQY